MQRWTFLTCACAVLAGTMAVSTTSIIPPTFDEMVSKADVIFLGAVVDQRSEWEPHPEGGRSIITHVTFDVERVLKGHVGLRTQLTFLGGTMGDLAMKVADMPEFTIGERNVLFVSPDQNAASPLVGFAYGRFRVTRDPVTGGDQIRTHDGRSLASTTDVGRSILPTLQSVRPMAYGEFEAAIKQRVALLRK